MQRHGRGRLRWRAGRRPLARQQLPLRRQHHGGGEEDVGGGGGPKRGPRFLAGPGGQLLGAAGGGAVGRLLRLQREEGQRQEATGQWVD